jgi:hypothetical protein
VAYEVTFRIHAPACIMNRCTEQLHFGICEGLPLPLSLILGEDLYAIKFQAKRILNSKMNATSNA